MAKQRDYRTEAIDLIDSRPTARFVAWGLPFMMRLAQSSGKSSRPLAFGRRFDLSESAILEWQYDPDTQQSEFGRLKERIILDRRPQDDIFSFDLQVTPKCTFAYQGPLTQQEIEHGCERPENVVGSYALFGPLGEKIGHLYRPWARDSADRLVWADLLIQPIHPGLWAILIAVPSDFLRDARYPVVLDPTFGYTTKGGTKLDKNANYVAAFGPWSPAENGAVQSVTCYLKNSYISANWTAGVYLHSGGATPDGRLVDGPGGSLTSTWDDWATQTMDSSPNIYSASSYWFAFNTPTSYLDIYYDTLIDKDFCFRTQVYSHGALPNDPAWQGGSGPPYEDCQFSIYATYQADYYAAGAPEMRRLAMVRGFRPGIRGIF